MVALVQSKYLQTSGGSGAGATISLDAAATTGNAICVTLELPTASVITSLMFGSNSLTLDKTVETDLDAVKNIYFYTATNITGTPTDLVLVLDADVTIFAWAEEVSGMAASSYVDVNPSKVTDSSGTTAVSAAVTTTTANAYIRSYVSMSGGQTATGTNGFTAYPGTSQSRHGVYDVDVGAAGAKSVTMTIGGVEWWAVSSIAYKNAGGGAATVSTITGTTATEASAVVFTVTMSGTGGGTFAYSWAGTATSADYTTTLTDDMFTTTGGSGSVTVSGGNIVVPSAVTAFEVAVPTTTDTLDEADETIRLVFGGVTSSSGTITDDDAPPTITGTTSQTVTAGSPIVITYSPGLSGQSRTYTLALTDGTATGGTDYDNTTVTGDFAVTAGTGSVSISGSTVTVDPGVTEFTLTITTTA